MRGMRTAFALLLAVSGNTYAGTEACDGDSVRVLQPVEHKATDSRAYWLDGMTIRWPGQPADANYRLVASTSAGLQVEPGKPVAGADHSHALLPANRVPADVAARFRFIGDGATLALPDDGRSGLRDLMRGQAMLVREDMAGNVVDATYLQTPGALDVLYAAAADDHPPPGATPGDGATWFRVWAPTAIDVSLCLYRDGTSAASELVQLAYDARTGNWLNGIPRDMRGSYYTYLVDVFVPGTGIVRNRVTDPYSVSLTTDSARSYIADLDDPALKPAGWDGAPRPPALASHTDMAIYELHVRDFSVNDATVPIDHRGRYLAFTDGGSNGMRHLRALGEAGITDIHLLPVFDIATIPDSGCATPAIPRAAADSDAQQAAAMASAERDCFNWGYDPFHFNAPEGSYASDAADGAVRIRELRAMVQALHAAGLRVGMDVVYNHTSASGQAPRSVLDRIVPGYYQRLMRTARSKPPPAATTPPPSTK